MKTIAFLLLCALACARAEDWPQDGGNAQRTGFTPESPQWPWTFAWTWNGPDVEGGGGAHRRFRLVSVCKRDRPDAPARDAYSEGILPRFTFVADGHILVQGNGGDILVLRHSGGR